MDSERIERIEKDMAIRDLVSRYCDAIVRRDAQAWGATWAEDGEWHVLGSAVKGRDKIIERWEQLIGGLPFIHQVASGGLLELDGEDARGRWYVTEYGVTGQGSGLLNLGVYHDDYVREAGQWCFARRRFGALYMGPPDLSGSPRSFPEDI